MIKHLLDELAEIDATYAEGEVTAEQENRGAELVELFNGASDLRSRLANVSAQLQTERKRGKENEQERMKATRRLADYRSLSVIYNDIRTAAESEAQAPIDDHYREALGMARLLIDTLQTVESALNGAAEYGFADEIELVRLTTQIALEWKNCALLVVQPYSSPDPSQAITTDGGTLTSLPSNPVIGGLSESLKDILSRLRSCKAQGNGEIEGDKEAIEKAEAVLALVRGGAA